MMMWQLSIWLLQWWRKWYDSSHFKFYWNLSIPIYCIWALPLQENGKLAIESKFIFDVVFPYAKDMWLSNSYDYLNIISKMQVSEFPKRKVSHYRQTTFRGVIIRLTSQGRPKSRIGFGTWAVNMHTDLFSEPSCLARHFIITLLVYFTSLTF